jgi:single-strand DNA-binding protein
MWRTSHVQRLTNPHASRLTSHVKRLPTVDKIPVSSIGIKSGTAKLHDKQFYYAAKFIIMIKLQVIGNLGKDCVTNTVNGKNVINFNVAHTEKFRDAQGNQKDKTIWVDCAYWTDRTGIAPYLKKGTQVYVDGSPEVKTFQKSDGTMGASLTLRVLSVQLLGSRSEGSAPSGGGYTNSNSGGNNYSNNNYNSSSNAPVPSPSDITEPVDDLPF